jgi:hypothetical protein
MQARADVGRITTILYICPHTTIYQTYRILYICPQTTIYQTYYYIYLSSYYYIHVSSSYFSLVLILLCIYMSSCYHIFVLVRLYMCPHTTVHASVGKAASAGARWRGQHLLLSPVLQSGLLRFSGMRTYI